MQALVDRAQAGLVRKRFRDVAELVAALYAALVEYLEVRELLRWGPFDAVPCADAVLDDLDGERMTLFIRTARSARQFPLSEATSPTDLLAHLHLLKNGRPTNAAVLLFGRSPQRFLLSGDQVRALSRNARRQADSVLPGVQGHGVRARAIRPWTSC